MGGEMYLTRVEGTSLKETLCYSRYLILVSICCKKITLLIHATVIHKARMVGTSLADIADVCGDN